MSLLTKKDNLYDQNKRCQIRHFVVLLLAIRRTYSMRCYWTLQFLLFFLVTTITCVHIGLRTQQGTIYGRQTQSSIEYLGYDNLLTCNTNTFLSLEFSMQKLFDGNRQSILHQKNFRTVHFMQHHLVRVVHNLKRILLFLNKVSNVST